MKNKRKIIVMVGLAIISITSITSVSYGFEQNFGAPLYGQFIVYNGTGQYTVYNTAGQYTVYNIDQSFIGQNLNQSQYQSRYQYTPYNIDQSFIGQNPNQSQYQYTVYNTDTTTINEAPETIKNQIQPLLVPANIINKGLLYDSQNHNRYINIYKLPGTNPAVLVFQSSGAIDCDGQKSIHCNERTDSGYQNETSFKQSNGKYLDAENVPYYVLPDGPSKSFSYKENYINKGQIGLMIFKNKMNYGVFGDENADTQSIGEMSYAMASSLGINPDPNNGGVSCCDVTYIIFTGTDNIVSPIENHNQTDTIGDISLKRLMQQIGSK